MSRRGTLGTALVLLLCLSVVAEVLSGSEAEPVDGRRGAWGLASWLMARGGSTAASRAGDLASGEWAPGVACWGPGVWPHPAHCSLFSVCRMTGSGVKGVLLRCPDQTAFITRRWRCYPDKRSNCGKRTIPPELLKASMEMRIPRISLSPRLGLCPFPKPYCSSDKVLTVCAPNHLLIGNVTCPTSCMEDEFGAFCDPEVGIETTTATKPTTTAGYSESLPILDANLMESAIKITSHLGLGPAPKNASNQTSQKPSGVRKPAVPAYTAPVFDLNSSPEEYSYETDQADAEKPAFSKPTVVVPGNEGSTTIKPLPTGNKDSDVFTIENVQSSVGAVMEQLMPVKAEITNAAIPLKGSTTEKYVDKAEEEKYNAEREKLEKEKLERDRLEKERLEKERLEKERLEKEKLEKERLEKEKLEKEKLEKEKLEREKLEKERLEKEKLEKEKLEREKLERERLEKEKLEKERLEKEKLERERLEKEKLERERLEKEKLERERLEKEKLERERLEKEKLERERLEKEKLERERLEKEKLERERLEKEKLERERLEKEKLEREKLEKEKLERDRLEKEKLEKEKVEREKLEKEKLEREKLEKEKLEKEKLEKDKLEKEKLEKLEKEKLEQEKLERERLEKEKLIKEKLEREKIEKEKLEKIKQQNEMKDQENKGKDQEAEAAQNGNSIGAITEQSIETSTFSPHDLSSVCKRPGLTCVNSNVLLECSVNLVPLRAWNCGSFFSRSATLIAKCDREKDSCVAAVGGNYTEEGGEDAGFVDSRPLCKRPGAQCADKSTLIHCSDDLRSATVAVCADLFPGIDGGAMCDFTLDACVVGIGDDVYSDVQVPTLTTTTEMPTQPIEMPSFSDLTTPGSITFVAHQLASSQTVTPVTEKFPGKPYPSDDPNDTFLALFPMMKDQCMKPGLRCFGGRVLEACERDNPKPVYRMDCSAVLADSLDARCEEQSEGEATCMVALHRNTPLLKGGQLPDAPLKEDDIYTLELSVVDVTRTFEYDDSELPPWKCSRVGQYCADESTLLSCSADLSVEFALSCGAIAPQSVVAFCDHTREACVVKKISDLTGGLTSNILKNVANQIQNTSNTAAAANEFNEPARRPGEQPVPTLEYSNTSPLIYANGQLGGVSGPTKWEFASISQLYPPDVPLGSYSAQSSKPLAPIEGSSHILSEDILKKNCSKAGPLCLDEFHLGSCSEELELRFVLPCSALYTSDPAPFCDATLSACLPSASRQTTTTNAPVTTTKSYTTETPTTTTTAPPTKAPVAVPAATTSQPSTFIPQQIPPYPPFNYPTPSGVQFGPPPHISNLQENQFLSMPGVHLPLPLAGSNFPDYPQLRPEAYTFFQRPNVNQYSPQQSRPPGFLQTLLQNYGARWPTFTQTFRPPTLSSFPFLNNIIQSFSTIRPPGVLQQSAEYGLHGGEEPYDYNDPQYQHYAEKYTNAYTPVTYHPILPGTQLIKEVGRPGPPVAGGVSSDMQSDLLKYYTSMLLNGKQPLKQSSGGYTSTNHNSRPKPQAPIESYLDQFLESLRKPNYGTFPFAPQTADLFKSKLPVTSSLANAGVSRRPTVHKVNSPEVTYTPGNSEGVSQVNPLTWLGKVEVPDAGKTATCKRPGMQCVDSDSLGACSKDLKLRYVIPCRNLLPFVSVGKPFCDVDNDACGVLVDDEKPEYPTDFTSYP